MSIVVYYHACPAPESYEADYLADQPFAEYFETGDLVLALQCAEHHRNLGHKHVCISSWFDDQVGKPGVDSIVDGKTPDGHEYDWKKRRV
jgi:hypothetical protein